MPLLAEQASVLAIDTRSKWKCVQQLGWGYDLLAEGLLQRERVTVLGDPERRVGGYRRGHEHAQCPAQG